MIAKGFGDTVPAREREVEAVVQGLPHALGAREVPSRLEYIDGLRALAALWVALHHTIEMATPTRALRTPVLGPLLSSLFFGQFPVIVFLMLSGFCLYHPYVNRNGARPRFETTYVRFLIRRAARIAPPYLWAGAFCLLLARIPQLQVGRWKEVGPVDAGAIVSHLLFVHNLIPRYATKIDYPMWSIGLEWQLYLLFPLMVWAFRKSNAIVVIGATFAVALLIRVTYRFMPGPAGAFFHDGPLSYLEIFAGGMLAAALTVRGHVVQRRWVVGAIAIAGMFAVRFGRGNGLQHDVATGAATFCLLLLTANRTAGVARALSAPYLVRIGVFSYSLYLVHAPLLHLFWLMLRPLHFSPDANFAALVIVCMPMVVALAYGFHRLFERPFMRAPRPAVAGRAKETLRP